MKIEIDLYDSFNNPLQSFTGDFTGLTLSLHVFNFSSSTNSSFYNFTDLPVLNKTTSKVTALYTSS